LLGSHGSTDSTRGCGRVSLSRLYYRSSYSHVVSSTLSRWTVNISPLHPVLLFSSRARYFIIHPFYSSVSSLITLSDPPAPLYRHKDSLQTSGRTPQTNTDYQSRRKRSRLIRRTRLLNPPPTRPLSTASTRRLYKVRLSRCNRHRTSHTDRCRSSNNALINFATPQTKFDCTVINKSPLMSHVSERVIMIMILID